MVDGEHGGGDEPGEAEDGADGDENGDNEQIEVISTAFDQLVLLPVDNDGRDLLVHKDQNGAQKSGNHGSNRSVPE